MKKYIEQTFGYDLREPLDKMRQYYYRHHDVTCDGSVPQAIIAFLESDDFEDAIRKPISIAGDSDTNACMAGGMAQAFYKGIPKEIEDKVRSILDERLNGVITEFTSKYCL